MGKNRIDDSDEEYFVKKGDKWVPIDLKGNSKAKSPTRDVSEEYFIKRDGRWVKVEGVNSTDDILRALKGGRSSRPIRETYTTTVQQPVVAPPEPQEYREYIVVIQPPPAPAPEPEVRPPVTVRPPPGRRPPPRRAVPNEYHEGPIRPEQADEYRGRPPPRYMGPPPRRPSPRRMPMIPPPPPPVVVRPPEYEEDAFELGREAYLRQTAVAARPCPAPCRSPPAPRGHPRTTAAPGYYLAGYLYYGDPASKPILQPAPGGVPVGVPQAPPGTYFAGYSGEAAAGADGGDCCGYPDHPRTVEMEYTEYGYDPQLGGAPEEYADDGQGYPEVEVYPGNEQGGYAAQGYPQGYAQGY